MFALSLTLPDCWNQMLGFRCYLIKSAEEFDRAVQVNLDLISINDKDGDEDIGSTTFEP